MHDHDWVFTSFVTHQGKQDVSGGLSKRAFAPEGTVKCGIQINATTNLKKSKISNRLTTTKNKSKTTKMNNHPSRRTSTPIGPVSDFVPTGFVTFIPASVRSARMSDPVSAIRNLGPATDKLYARAGIHTAEQLRDLGPDEAYKRILQSGARPHFIGYYALVMGLQGRPWNDCKGTEKQALRKRFDAIKVSGHDKGRSELETALNRIGVIRKVD